MARMLVEKQRVRDGNPTGCVGVTFEDGTRYFADRAGHINIDNPVHLALIKSRGEGFVVEERSLAVRAAGSTCSSCGFDGFAFHLSAPCPRCGGVMERNGTA